jgi:hypothetical protein
MSTGLSPGVEKALYAGAAVSGLAGIVNLLSSGDVKWSLLLGVAALCAVFLGAYMAYDRTMVKTGRAGALSSSLVLVGTLLALAVVLLLIGQR